MKTTLAGWWSAAAASVGSVAFAASFAAAAAPAAARVDALDVAAIPLERIDGFRPHELSGLAWDHAADVLYAVSDRGVLFAWQLRLAGERIERFAPLWARPLAPTGRRLNAEAIDVKRGTGDAHASLIVADELGAAAWSLELGSSASIAFTALAWPAGLADRAGARTSKQGIEALAWSTRWGAMSALQRPRSNAADAPHEIHADHAPQPWLLSRASVPRSTVKAIEAAPTGHVIVLEKVGGGSDVHRLRRFDPQACTPAGCTDRALEVPAPPGLPETLNWEGLACRPDGVCVVVSDDADLVGHGWLMLLRLRIE